MKKIVVVWTCVMLVIFGVLTFIGLNYKKNNVYNLMENSLKDSAKDYFGMYPGLLPKKDEVRTITYEELIKNNYDPKFEKNCLGYVVVSSGGVGYEYTPYIKCNDYETKGFKYEN